MSRAWLLTANDLLDGRIVHWTGEGWSSDLSAALAVSVEAERAELEALAGEANRGPEVVGAYLIEVDLGSEGVRPRQLRERRRLAGPSISYGPSDPGDRATQSNARRGEDDVSI